MRRFFASLISGELFGQAIAKLWPLALPVLAAVAQYFAGVPLPYFVMVFAVTLAAAVSIIARERGADVRELITPSLAMMHQLQTDAGGPLAYTLQIDVTNSSRRRLYYCVESAEWTLAGESRRSVDAIKTQELLPPGKKVLSLPTIRLPKCGLHTGDVKLRLSIGERFGAKKWIVKVNWQFQLPLAGDAPLGMLAEIPTTSKTLEFSIEPFKAS